MDLQQTSSRPGLQRSPSIGPSSSPLLLDRDDTPLLWSEIADEKGQCGGHPESANLHPKRRLNPWCLLGTVALLIISMSSGWAMWSLAPAAVGKPVYSAFLAHFNPLLRNDLSKAAEETLRHRGAILDAHAPRIDFSKARTVQELDVLACARSPCQFLSIASVKEQNTKSELHLSQIAILANRIDRALVLPNVFRGRLSTCFEQPFDLYHDPNDIAEMFNVSTILWPDFQRYTSARAALSATLTKQSVSVLAAQSAGPRPAYRFRSEADASECTGEGVFVAASHRASELLSGHKAITHNATLRIGFGEWLVETLTSTSYFRKSDYGKHGPPDVLHMTWGMGIRLFDRNDEEAAEQPQEGPALAFHPRWIELADEIARDMSPAVALHWRQETLDDVLGYIPDFATCAKAAEQSILDLGSEVKTVFFMTDYPLDSTVHSDSYISKLNSRPELREAATAGIDELLNWSAFNQTDAQGKPVISIMTLDALELYVALGNGERVLLKDLDSGLLGVLDKLIAERLSWYLVGAPLRCARFSNYSVQLVHERRKRMKAGDGTIKTDVSYFPVTSPAHGYD